MVFVKHNSLKSDMFFNPIFVSGFSGSGPGSRVRVQVSEVAQFIRSFSKFYNHEESDCVSHYVIPSHFNHEQLLQGFLQNECSKNFKKECNVASIQTKFL